MAASLDLLLRVVSVVPSVLLTGPRDPWLYFYEDFLAAYDPKLRKDAGAYYTPVEVVRAQVRLVDDVLVHRLQRPLGFAGPGVVTLDPAAGTGTYLLGVIEHALGRVEAEQGAGAVAGQAAALAENLYGFELMVGPYAVSELRVSRALRDRGAPPGTARARVPDGHAGESARRAAATAAVHAAHLRATGEGARGQERGAGPRLLGQSALRPPRGGESRQRGVPARGCGGATTGRGGRPSCATSSTRRRPRGTESG